MSENVSDVIERIVEARMSAHATSSDSDRNVSDIIRTIRDVYERDWNKQKLDLARQVLSRTWAGIPLPVLTVCGRGTQEIRYSTYLAYFLDGSKRHGLGTSYLDELLAFLREDEDRIDTYESIVEPEKVIGELTRNGKNVGCQCDIVVTCPHADHVIFIEQKIGSGESPHPDSDLSQLQRYDEAIRENPEYRGKAQTRVFLTPDGKASPTSPHWQPLSYRDLGEVGLSVLHAGGLSNTARENFRRFLIDLLLGPIGRAESEIEELVYLAQSVTAGPSFRDRLHFDQMVSRNRMLVDLLMEG